MNCGRSYITSNLLLHYLAKFGCSTVRHQHARMFCEWLLQCFNDALLQCCAKRVAGVVAIYCADLTSDDVIGTQKRQLSSRKSIKQKCLLVHHSKMKLSSDVSIIPANISE